MKVSAMLLCDFYKLAHREMYPEGTEIIYSTWTPRESRIKGVDEVVVAGNQAFIKEWLIDFFNDNFFKVRLPDVLEQYVRIVKNTLGVAEPGTKHIVELHNLGYLPLKIKAIAEGTVVPLRTPVLTVQNTDPKFFWLTNYIESLMSCELWPIYTSATLAHEYRKMLDKFAMETVGNTDFVPFQGHDFSFRGMEGLYAAAKTGMGHLMSFVGTDTIPAIIAAEHYYGANVEKELVGCSIPASEHSIQCTYEDDMAYFDNLITKVHPKGFVSIVSDGYDLWDVVGRVLPALKSKIMAREGKVVIRPDSGDPVLIVCGDPKGKTPLERKGTVEALWDIFGGTLTEKGYRVIDGHAGLIYGDAITVERAKEICERLKLKNFASINCVFGIGSFTYQYNTRDTFGFAMKSTLAVINGKEKHIFKDPKTDSGVKKSQKGRVFVWKNAKGKIEWKDGVSLTTHCDGNLLEEIFKDGKLVKAVTFTEIRNRLVGKV
jgi:nicotinamide phosphoribosyltransferase